MTNRLPATTEYLSRIGLTEPPGTDLEALTLLQQAHLAHVPFENIDVYRQTGVRTDLAWSVDKIVARRRGGWCFENNGAFGWLLTSLGFSVTYLGAHVLTDPRYIDHMSHLCLRIDLEEPYLVDVGFGDSFTSPIPLDPLRSIDVDEGSFRLEHGDAWVTLMGSAEPPNSLYRFTLTPRSLDDFTQQSERLQRAGTGRFTEKPFATRSLGQGTDRVTLLADRIRFRRNEAWTEDSVDPDSWNGVARQWFGLELD